MNALNRLSKRAFYSVAPRENWAKPVECDSLVFLPLGTRLHDSGYRFMDAVACDGETLLCRVSGCSDAFEINSTSNIFTKESTPFSTGRVGFDVLARSGLLRVWRSDGPMYVSSALSTLSIYPLIAKR